jgi:hypothetical protein
VDWEAGLPGDSSQPMLRPRVELPELNSLRAIAGVLMLVNHAGVDWFSPQRITELRLWPLVFLGSFAPVVFFFVTGVGYGITRGKAGSGGPHRFGLARKVAVLVLADAVMWLGPGRWTGMDFLGFIALSMLVLEPLRASKRALAWAAGGFALIVLVRFGIGPAILRAQAEVPGGQWLAALAGVRGFAFVPDSPWYPYVSFSPVPWLAFPLAGFICGRWAPALSGQCGGRRGLWMGGLLAAAGAGVVATDFLARHGMVLFRWGTMSFAYFVASWTLLAAAVDLVMVLFSLPRLYPAVRCFSLRGLASLAFVPAHMVVIWLLLPCAGRTAGLTGFLLLAGLGTVLAFVGSAMVSRVGEATRRLEDTTVPWLIICVVVLAVGASRVLFDTEGTAFRTLSGGAAQAMLCVGLVLPWPVAWGFRRRRWVLVAEPGERHASHDQSPERKRRVRPEGAEGARA